MDGHNVTLRGGSEIFSESHKPFIILLNSILDGIIKIMEKRKPASF